MWDPFQNGSIHGLGQWKLLTWGGPPSTWMSQGVRKRLLSLYPHYTFTSRLWAIYYNHSLNSWDIQVPPKTEVRIFSIRNHGHLLLCTNAFPKPRVLKQHFPATKKEMSGCDITVGILAHLLRMVSWNLSCVLEVIIHLNHHLTRWARIPGVNSDLENHCFYICRIIQ